MRDNTPFKGPSLRGLARKARLGELRELTVQLPPALTRHPPQRGGLYVVVPLMDTHGVPPRQFISRFLKDES